MEKLKFELSCGAIVEIERAPGGFYLTVEQENERVTWVTTDKAAAHDRESQRYSYGESRRYKTYVRAYLSDNPDLADAFVDIAAFIAGNRRGY